MTPFFMSAFRIAALALAALVFAEGAQAQSMFRGDAAHSGSYAG